MKKVRSIIKISLIALIVSLGAANATTSTINPAVPAANSPLSSATVRSNFLSAYNDVNALWASLTASSNYVNLRSLGLPTGGDDTAAINAAIQTAKTKGISVYAPCGIYNHHGVIVVDSVHMFGDGVCTLFRATDTTNTGPLTAIQLTGTYPSVDNFKAITIWTGGRVGSDAATLIEGWYANNFSITNIIGDTSPTGGIVIDYSTFGTITNNAISNTIADAILVQNGSSYVTVSQNRIYNPGDTCASVASYTPTGLVHNVNIENNMCYHGILTTSGYTSCGGNEINIEGNNVQNLTEGSGIYVFAGGTYSCNNATNINIEGNVIDVANGSVPNLDVRGLTIVTYGSNTISSINVIGNTFTGAQGATIEVGDASTAPTSIKDINISKNFIGYSQSGGSGEGLLIESGSNLTVEGNTFAFVGSTPIVSVGNTTSGAGFLKILGNDFHDNNTSARSGQEGINVYNTGFSTLYVQNNTQENGAYSFDSFLYENGITNLYVSGNVTDNTNLTNNATNSHFWSLTGAYSSITNALSIGTSSQYNVANKLTVQGDTTGSYASDLGQLIVRGNSDSTKRFGMMIDTTNNIGVLQAAKSGTGVYPMALNPQGGNVSIGTTASVSTLTVNGTTTSTAFSGSGSGLTGIPASSLTGTVPVANGGTGTATAFTQGSIVFAGASGNYSQDNSKLFWSDSSYMLGIGSATPSSSLDIMPSANTASATQGFVDVHTNAWNGPFFTAHQVGSGYSYSGAAMFQAITDNAVGSNSYCYQSISASTTTFQVRCDGLGYFAGMVGIGSTVPHNQLTVSADGTGAYASDNGNGQILAQGLTDPTKRLGLMIDTTNNEGVIQAAKTGTGPYPLLINPQGGNVSIGTTANTSALTIGGTVIASTFSGSGASLTGVPATSLTGTIQAAQEPSHTGDVTNSAGSLAMTLATVNSNTGSFGSSTAIPSFTVNGKGLITASSTNVVIAPAGTLSGSALASGVTSSSLTSVGTLASLTVGSTFTVDGTGDINASGTGIVQGSSFLQGLNSPLAIEGGSPQAQFINASGSRLAVMRFNSANGARVLIGDSPAATIGAHSAMTVGNAFGEVDFFGDDGTNYGYTGGIPSVAMVGQVDNTVSTGIIPGKVFFQTQNSVGSLVTALTINSAQNVGILTTTPQASFDDDGGTFLVRGGSAPTISSCGTSPVAPSGSPSSFYFTAGSGALTSCVINWTWPASTAPKTCTLTPANATASATGTTLAYITPSNITSSSLTITGTVLTSAAYHVQCF